MKTLLMLATLLLQQAGRPQFGTVDGQIRNVDGSAAASVRVAAMAEEEIGTLVSLTQSDSEGRYQLQNVPPGRYLIAAGFLDLLSYYPGVKTTQEARSIAVTAGETARGINFTLAYSGGVRVRGVVKNLPGSPPPELVRVVLQPMNRPTAMTDTAVSGDGRFEFLRVAPGTYNLRLNPSAGQPLRLEIVDKDIDTAELIAAPMVFGRVRMDDDSPLPTPRALVAAGAIDVPAQVRLQAYRVDRAVAQGMATALVRQNGLIVFPFPEAGDYMVGPALMPLGYYLKSMTHGSVDLLQLPLKVEAAPTPTDLQVMLTRTPPAGTPAGFKISGRVIGLANAGAGITLFVNVQSQATAMGTSPIRLIVTAETAVGADGTFEITGVPPGRYMVRTIPLPGPSQTVDILDRDVTGLELTVSSATPPPPLPPRPLP